MNADKIGSFDFGGGGEKSEPWIYGACYGHSAGTTETSPEIQTFLEAAAQTAPPHDPQAPTAAGVKPRLASRPPAEAYCAILRRACAYAWGRSRDCRPCRLPLPYRIR